MQTSTKLYYEWPKHQMTRNLPVLDWEDEYEEQLLIDAATQDSEMPVCKTFRLCQWEE